LLLIAFSDEGCYFSGMSRFNRVILVVLDGVGIGEMPDAAEWGDAGSDTLGHVLESEAPRLPQLQSLGLGNIRPLPNCPLSPHPEGAFGKAAILSKGKDTTVGHWEMAGLITPEPFPTYPEGFPERILRPFKEGIGRDVLGNKPASGTEIIKELGEEHVRTGKPIVYTSADSVFQVAAHEQVIPLDELYRICRIARALLDGRDRVARVIARPFLGSAGKFQRTGNRKDFAIPPPAKTLLDDLQQRGAPTLGVGKVPSLFDYQGISDRLEAHDNRHIMEQTIHALQRVKHGLVFSNFVDFDMLWGHRNDPKGFAAGLEEFDRGLSRLRAAMRADDCLIITADHGCDPITPSTDHSREYVPVLACGPAIVGGADLGVRSTLADIGQTIAENFGFALPVGTSFLARL
jgi:phosphopentomutase